MEPSLELGLWYLALIVAAGVPTVGLAAVEDLVEQLAALERPTASA